MSALPAVARAAAKKRYATAKHARTGSSRGDGPLSADEVQQAEYEFRDAREAHRQACWTPKPP